MMIRKYKTTDCEEIAQLFYETVHSVNARDYSSEQRNAWVTGSVDMQVWNHSFLKHYTMVAVDDERIVGFGDIDRTGYLDHLFIHKDYQGKGVASVLCNELEMYALKNGASVLSTHTSITAKPFFQRRGYEVMKEQQVERNGVKLTNFVMKKV